jgi:glycosyltransferase involved in cell wall biosynthesis/ADP-heptose:LPS heptosyltransferase
VKAILKTHSDHEIILLLNGALRESIESIRGLFEHDISQDCIKVFEIPSPVSENNPENDSRARSAEILRETVIESLSPDWVLVTSLFEGWGDDACVALTEKKRKFRTAIVLYDLIPLALPDQSFAGSRHRSWYENKLKSLLRSDLLLAISNFTRQDAISRLAIGPESIKTINAGVDERFYPKILSEKEKDILMEKFSFGSPFLLYVPGGFEWKKNFDALLHAFSLLPENLRNHYRIVIPGKHPSTIRERLLNLSARFGIIDRVHFPGYVSDDDLIGLYRTTSLFVFPSLYEGVGLPLLEAMACGVPVIGSKTTSIPEVIGFEKGLFDPENPHEIAKTIETFLTDLRLRDVAVTYGLKQVQKFSWNQVAVKTLEALEEYKNSIKNTNKNILISDFGLFKRRSKRILVMKLDHRGDLILAIPAIRKLRSKYPDAHIDLLVGQWNFEIAETLNLGNNIFSVNFFQDQSSDDSTSTYRNEFQKLLKNLGQYDIAIDFRRQRDTRFLLLEIDAKQRVGYKTHDERIDSRLDILLDSELDRSGEMIVHNRRSIALQMLDIVEALDKDDSDFLMIPEIYEGNKNQFGVAVFPFAGNPVRAWGLSNFEYVIFQLNKDPSVDVIHIYTSEKEGVHISKAIRQCQKVFIHEGLPFRSLLASLKENSVALANNSFGAHVSALAGLKVVGVYSGHEKADEWAPVFGKGHSIFQVDLPCSPCHLPSLHDCNHGMECLTLISADLVLERILELTKFKNRGKKGEGSY